MLSKFTASDLTLFFLGNIVCLGSALIWMVWELEHRLKPLRTRRKSLSKHPANVSPAQSTEQVSPKDGDELAT